MMILALTQNQECVLAFIMGIAAIFICAWIFPDFTDKWPEP